MYQIPDVISFDKPGVVPAPIIEDAENKKRLFGIELAKGLNPFESACSVCGQNNTSQALYVSQHWVNDINVIAAKDLYLKAVYNSNDLLDAEELAAKLLEMVEERNATNTFYMLEGKDRVATLKLYAEVRGFLKKDTPIPGHTFIQNTMTIKLVEPTKKIIEQVEDKPEEIVNSVSPVKLKLVG